MKLEFYRTRKEFFLSIQKLLPNLDFNKCFSRSRHSLVLKTGESWHFGKIQTLLQHINNLLEKEHFNPAFSHIKGKSAYCIAINEVGDESPVKVLSAESVKEEVIEEILPQETEVVVSEDEDSVISLEFSEQSVESVVEETKQPDWEWIETLQNTKEDRVALDAYATEEFDVPLKQNMKLSNMIKAFKEAL